MSKRLIIIFLASCIFSINVNSQDIPFCGTDQYVRDAFLADPEYKSNVEEFRIFAKKYTKEKFRPNQKGNVYQIPIVFHIVHNFNQANVSDNVIKQVVAEMNNHWRKKEADTTDIEFPFNLIHDDMEVEFVLAHKDPNGNCSSGITRYISDLSVDATDAVKAYTKSIIDWPSSDYLNVWVVTNCESGAGGYAYYPGASNAIDGIVMPTNVFRNMAHEAGHWLSLAHPWGSTNEPNNGLNCGTDDGIDDTPNCDGSPSNCNIFRQTCDGDPDPFYSIDSVELWSGSEISDNVQNYMDYGWCDAENFTQGQKARVHAALNSSLGDRDNIWTAANLMATGADSTFSCEPIPVPDFILPYEYVCTDLMVEILNNTYNSNDLSNVEYAWDFDENSFSNTTNSSTPSVLWGETGAYDISVIVNNPSSVETNTLVKNGIAKVLNGEAISPFHESFDSQQFPINDVNDPTKTWFVDALTNPKTWERTLNASTEGASSLYLDIKKTNGIHRLISPMIDFTQSACNTLTFDLAYAPRTNSALETFRVKVSTTCGRVWNENDIVYEVSRQDIAPNTAMLSGDFVPNADNWKSHSIDLSDYNSDDDLLIMFEFSTNSGNALYMDNINFGCSDVNTIDEVNNFDFAIYPNPTKNDVFVKLPSNHSSLDMSITDVSGRQILNTNISSNVSNFNLLDFTNIKLEKGVYLFSIRDDNQIITKKLVVN